MTTRAFLLGMGFVAVALLTLHALGGTSAQATCELGHSASTCAYALR